MPSHPALVRSIVGITGGLAFAASMGYFAWAYLVRFDATGPGAWAAVSLNTALFTLFALHHSLFARAGLKAWVAGVVPETLERAVYVWIASILFAVVCTAWLPVRGVFWQADAGLRVALSGVQMAAGVFVLAAARHLDVLDLAGVRGALGLARRHTDGLDDFGPYGLVRHPIYLGWVLFVWATPFMNGTRFTFAVVSTIYLVAAIPFEERDLRRTHGTAYADYSRRVRFRMIPGVY